MTDTTLNDLRSLLIKLLKYLALDGAPRFLSDSDKDDAARQIAWIDALTEEERQNSNTLLSASAWESVVARMGPSPTDREQIMEILAAMRRVEDELGRR